MNITLKQLRIFTTLAKSANIGQAALALSLTKPAVSMAIKELEHQLNQSLFERLPNRLKLNSQGELLLPLAHELLSRSDEISSLFDGNQLSGELHIGCSKTIGNQLMPALLAQFRQLTGHQRQSLQIMNSRDVCQLVARYELDLGLIEANVCLPGQVLIPWHQDSMCIIAPPNHPLAQQKQLPLHALDQQNWVLREDGSGSRALFNREVAPHLNQWHLALELNEAMGIINCVSSNLGLSCISELTATDALQSGKVVALDLAKPLYRPLYLVFQENKRQSVLFQRFVEHLKQSVNG
ncbi:LysR family transcriptional regulator [Motilimonas cestriensis]|uniref:LysR family transcriptional regulator n=1 Tax=Motilimonas cestriensis TaxID=2742685 RepID=A0ABS8WEG8_9GAMM|nr:LysR substrate-binding domain-containing protein [Motilimonas cestriensis]MCE2596136.1 LysR family transcriptional regulator [Motilimonas cestriensis]